MFGRLRFETKEEALEHLKALTKSLTATNFVHILSFAEDSLQTELEKNENEILRAKTFERDTSKAEEYYKRNLQYLGVVQTLREVFSLYDAEEFAKAFWSNRKQPKP